MAAEQSNRERQEIAFWSESEHESPGKESLHAFTTKMSEAKVVLEKFDTFRDLFASAGTVLELGGGQGWASAMFAREFRPEQIVTTDISPWAVMSSGEWERVFKTQLGGALACRSYEIPVRDCTFDLVFVFAAAHHFGAHRRTLSELMRILKPNGSAVYLHEPACRNYIYPLALRRVTAKRPVVPEDLIRYQELESLAGEAGFQYRLVFAPTTTYRGSFETTYYMALQRSRVLRSYLPCSVDICLTKPA